MLEPGRAFYIWGGYANVGNYPPVLKECNLYFSQSIIWDKQHPVLTRKDYMGAHEWCCLSQIIVFSAEIALALRTWIGFSMGRRST